MRLNRYTLAFGFLAVVLLAFILIPSHRAHKWNMDHNAGSPEGTDPYNCAIFDQLMERSLPNGYSTHEVDIDDRYDGRSIIPDFDPNDTKPNLSHNILAVQFNPWFNIVTSHINSDGETVNYSISPIHDLDAYAQTGGKAMYVIGRGGVDSGLSRYFMQIGYCFEIDDFVYSNDTYTKDWWKSQEGGTMSYPTKPDESILIDIRYAPLCMRYNEDVDYSLSISDSLYRINISSLDNLIRSDYIELYRTLRNTHPTPAEVYLLIGDTPTKIYYHQIYAIEICYPQTGGCLVITTLGMYFCNLGIELPNNAEIYDLLFSRIDDKPVMRLYSAKKVKQVQSEDNPDTGLLSVLKANEALWLAWLLLLALMLIFVVSGCVRRKPVRKGIDDLDHTDYVAVREHKFRKSPLLHFLYQCAWMYNRKNNHSELFDVNYRRVACIVDKYTGIQLSSANDADLLHAASVLASRLNRDRDEILQQLTFMLQWHDADYAFVPARVFSRSQDIAESLSV